MTGTVEPRPLVPLDATPVVDVGAMRAEIERLTRERDIARASIDRWAGMAELAAAGLVRAQEQRDRYRREAERLSALARAYSVPNDLAMVKL